MIQEILHARIKYLKKYIKKMPSHMIGEEILLCDLDKQQRGAADVCSSGGKSTPSLLQ